MYQFETKQNRNGRLLIQTSLKVGHPGDKYEQEADRVADHVMRMSENETIQQQPIEEEEEELQPKLRMQPIEEEEEELMPKLRMQSSKEEEEEPVQAKAKTGEINASPNLENQISDGNGKGEHLPPHTNQFMSSALGADFSSVRVHTGSDAVSMNQELGARAFTFGNDIYFNNSEYNPEHNTGKRLLAHELTHVVQQADNEIQTLIQRSTAAESLQRIEDAASGWGTDEEGIFNAIRECTELPALRSNPRVTEVINDEMSGYDLFKAKLLLKYGPESNFPAGILLIWEATHGAGTDEEMVYDAIRSSSQRDRLKRSTWVQRTLRNEMSGHDYAKTQLLFQYGNESAYPPYINPLWRATVGAGTDEDLLFNSLISLTPTDIRELSANTAFIAVIRDDLSGSDLQRFNDILNGTSPLIRPDNQATSSYGGVQTGPVAVTGTSDPAGTHDFAPDDVNQGEVGDCYFLASLAAIANTNPELLRNMITPQTDGSYNVELQVRDGERFSTRIVNVTPRFPEYSTGSGEIYARGGDTDAAGNTELWVRLIEKAFAKLRGSYEEIHGGFERDALEILTGQRAEEIELDDVSNEDLVTRLEQAFNTNHPVTAATKTNSFFEDLETADAQFATSHEIISSHAYTVMSITNSDITLRNPHGAHIGALAVQTLTFDQFRLYFYLVTTLRIG